VRDSGLTIVGSGRLAEPLQALAKSLGVSESVKFESSVSHGRLAECYRRAELLVFPSTTSSTNDQEGLGLVVIEALGCNCPVLASDVASLTDVIVDGETGFVFPKGDATALAARLNELMADPERCADVAKRGGDLARARFDWSIVGKRYASLYHELADRPG
jgi:glycosyltransferase involved in cell wall biosynthesis